MKTQFVSSRRKPGNGAGKVILVFSFFILMTGSKVALARPGCRPVIRPTPENTEDTNYTTTLEGRKMTERVFWTNYVTPWYSAGGQMGQGGVYCEFVLNTTVEERVSTWNDDSCDWDLSSKTNAVSNREKKWHISGSRSAMAITGNSVEEFDVEFRKNYELDEGWWRPKFYQRVNGRTTRQCIDAPDHKLKYIERWQNVSPDDQNPEESYEEYFGDIHYVAGQISSQNYSSSSTTDIETIKNALAAEQIRRDIEFLSDARSKHCSRASLIRYANTHL